MMNILAMKRRRFLQGAALAAGGALLNTRLLFAGVGTGGDSRLIVVIMRGAVDGLAAVPPYGDPAYARLRGTLAIAAPGATDGALPLDTTFGLHPQFAFLHEAFGAGELAVFHAVATPYRDRSHFDGQDVLESGVPVPHASQTGWLNRALATQPRSGAGERGVALGSNVPLMMRGPAPVASWAPTKLAELDQDTLQRIADLYSHDPMLGQRLADAQSADAMAGGQAHDAMGGAGANRYAEVIRATAGFLANEAGPRVAVFDTTGWDTHANGGGARGQLGVRFGALDTALRTLKTQLGSTWRSTAVLAVTEFGRTAAVNGTGGSDHGTGTAALLLGGAVRGGRVICDWPGLSAANLYQQRDVAPTLDIRALLKGTLVEHMGVGPGALDAVFPDSGRVKPLRDLFRA
ncbi:MAG TPA: DUF1501 domain-containing protein [Steroidobacteraceae bacterium]|jgi:uncharacterized protein (DUF1501 family)|nr:DUF1501 domain-containing protein [Steroidobacteraceae bacterium]